MADPNTSTSHHPSPSLTFQTVDCWRGLAALWVVMYHACLGPIDNDYPGLAHQPIFAFSLNGRLGVILFFILSGYCIANSAWSAHSKPGGIKRFTVARLRRIYPAYLLSSLLIVGLSAVAYLLSANGWMKSSWLGSKDFFHRDWQFYLANITMMQVPMGQEYVNAVSWSLCYEITFYGIIALALCGTRRWGKGDALFHVLSGLTLLSLGWLIFLPKSCPFPLDMWPAFGLGLAIYWVLSSSGSRASVSHLAGIVILMAIFAFSRCSHPMYVNYLSSRVVVAFCAVFGALFLISFRYDARLAKLPGARHLAALGGFSYSLYLIHVTVLGMVNQIGKKVGIHEANFWMLFCTGIVAAIIAGRVFYRLFEAPFMKKRRSKATVEVPDFPAPLAVVPTA